jgi:SSS family solute:Na+ symporter
MNNAALGRLVSVFCAVVTVVVFIVILMVAVSFFTKAPSAAQVEAITFSKEYRREIRESWNVWDIVGTLGVLFLCGCFYWYFF